MPLPLERTKSMGSPTAVTELVCGLSGFGTDEVYEPRRQVKRSMSNDMKRAMESLEFSEIDLELLADDNRQFEVLKQSLRNKGAVTNETLKQKLPLYLKYRKDRFARSNPETAEAMRRLPQRTKSTGRIKPVSKAERASVLMPANRVLTDKELQEVEEPQSILGRILRPVQRTRSGGLPQRTKSNDW